VARDEIVPAITTILEVYAQQRIEEESFLNTVKRIGIEPFKEKVYANS
jgi:sulfite reductase (NADPH) hemoprotein beta-component